MTGRRAPRLVAAVLALLALAGAAKPVPAENQLLAADRAFSKLSVEKGQPYAFLAYVANDGRLYGTGSEPPVYGKAQAFRRLARRDPGSLRWEPEIARVSADGRMGWTAGHWFFNLPGSKTSGSGHYLTVWVKDRSGAWKVQADMGTTGPAPKK